jgi:uncharacterized repeat protein (TIGR01451 family)
MPYLWVMKRLLHYKFRKTKDAALLLMLFLSVNCVHAQKDTIPPVITLFGDSVVYIEQGSSYTDAGATAFDNKMGNITSQLYSSTDLDVNVVGAYTFIYNVSDNDGNKAKPAIRRIFVFNDLTKPVINLIPDKPGCIPLKCDNPPYIDPGATASDNKAPFNLSSSIISSGKVDTRKIGTYTIVYEVQDVAGNKAIPVTRTVCVETPVSSGFDVIPVSGGYKIYTDSSMNEARTAHKWYIDNQYVTGKDNANSLNFYVQDNLPHQICIDEKLCDEDSFYRICKVVTDTVVPPISGQIYLDKNSDCSFDNNDLEINYLPVKLYDNNNQLIGMSYSNNSQYQFNVDHGQYNLKLDLGKYALDLNCSDFKLDTNITLNANQQVFDNLNFPLECKTGFDVGVIRRPSRMGAVPGMMFSVNPFIGDLNKYIGTDCDYQIQGRIEITMIGKTTFEFVPNHAIQPDSIIGNRFVYNISDFGDLTPNDIHLIFSADTTAFIGDTIYAKISISPKTGDDKLENNDDIFPYIVRTSYDPNIKEVYPVDVEPSYDDWFYYTVHFQNTGTAPARKIRITDTLSNKLDVETFQLLGTSHPMKLGLKNDALVFFFADINLPDSFTDEKNSHGYVQYRVKPVKNHPEGTKINNTAYIFFDYNEPIVTNTTVNTYVEVKKVGLSSPFTGESFQLYPNPGTGVFNIGYEGAIENNANIEIYDLFGKLLYTCPMHEVNTQLNLSEFSSGIYICKLNTGNTSIYKTFVKQ